MRVADNCALIANAAFSRTAWGRRISRSTLLGTYAFAWQIYGDFSGYSDIARGSAQLIGFHFMVNFRQPYLATSLQDFWRRWHISLSTWLRDYLYIPLGGNRDGEAKTYRNLMLTMLLGGLWHGANWTFVVWGGIHGAGLAVERFFTRALGIVGTQDQQRSHTRQSPARPGASQFALRLAALDLADRDLPPGVPRLDLFRAESRARRVRHARRPQDLTWAPEYTSPSGSSRCSRFRSS